MRLEPNLVYRSNLFVLSKNNKNSDSLAWNRKRRDLILMNTFYDFFSIKLDLFEDLILDNPILYMPTQNEGKGVF